jgi:hypothetical protein
MAQHVGSTTRARYRQGVGKVTAEFTCSLIWVKKQLLCGDVINSHGDAICQLDLSCGVIDLLSLWQMRRVVTGQT